MERPDISVGLYHQKYLMNEGGACSTAKPAARMEAASQCVPGDEATLSPKPEVITCIISHKRQHSQGENTQQA